MEISGKIAEKAGELFLKYGVRPVTMADIASGLGMAKKTIYKFFGNKNALVENFIQQETAVNSNSCNMLEGACNDPVIGLFFTMVYARKFHLRLSPAVTVALQRDHHNAYLIFKQHKDVFLYNAIKNNIQKGIRLSLYQNDFDEAVMARFFLESLTIMADKEVFPSEQPGATGQEDLIGHVIAGIATPQGLDKINWYKSQHLFTSFTQTFTQPYWED